MHMHLLLFTTLCPPTFWFAHSIFLTSLRQCCQVRGPRSKSRPGQEFGSIFLLRTLLLFWDHKPHLSGYIYQGQSKAWNSPSEEESVEREGAECKYFGRKENNTKEIR